MGFGRLVNETVQIRSCFARGEYGHSGVPFEGDDGTQIGTCSQEMGSIEIDWCMPRAHHGFTADNPCTLCRSIERATKPDAFISSTNALRYSAAARRARGVPMP